MTLRRLICCKPAWNGYRLQILLSATCCVDVSVHFSSIVCFILTDSFWANSIYKVILPFLCLKTVPPDTQVISSSSLLYQSLTVFLQTASISWLFGQISNLLPFQDLLNFYHLLTGHFFAVFELTLKDKHYQLSYYVQFKSAECQLLWASVTPFSRLLLFSSKI